MAEFLVSVSSDIPWHVTAFHPDHKMTATPATTARQLIRAAEIAWEEGLHFDVGVTVVFALARGNTFCPQCHTALIERAWW